MAASLSRYLAAAAATAVIAAQAIAFAPAHAGSEAAFAQAQPTSTIMVARAGNPNRQVCTLTRITGSRFPRRLCRTAAERDAAEKEAQDATRDFLAQDYVSPNENGESIGTGGPDGTSRPSPN